MHPKKDLIEAQQKALKVSKGVVFCLATVVGKFASYPDVDEATFFRVHQKITAGLLFHSRRTVGDFCQELRAVTVCPVDELLEPEEVLDADGNEETLDETELRLIALAEVVHRKARLSDGLFRELLTGLLSWDASDRLVILNTLTGIVRGQ